jgi:hypothetical protein
VHDLALLGVPVAALAYLTIVGGGAAVALSPRFPADAQAALAPVTGAALIAVTSVLIALGTPARPLAVGVGVLGASATAVVGRRLLAPLRACTVPLVLALCAITLAGAPALGRGNWDVTSLYGSTDAYHWTSQARAYLNGPAPNPTTEHPDRLTYERSRSQHWAVALPFGVLQLAWLSGSDPPDVYAAFAVVVFCLLPLAAFAVARALLGWRPGWAAVAAGALLVNSALLFANHFSWQQQLAGTAFAFAATAVLRLGLEPAGHRRELALAALLAAAALATYRLGFAPYLGALIAAVALAYAFVRRDAWRAVAQRIGEFLAMALCLAIPSLIALAEGLPDFVSAGGFSTTFKREFPSGQLGEVLGLVPSIWSREEGWSEPGRLAWLVVATIVTVVLLAIGARTLGISGAGRADFLLAGAALTVGAYLVLLLPRFAAYLSFKVLAYGAPFFVLVALAPFVRQRLPRALVPVLACIALVSAGVATAATIDRARTPGALSALPGAQLSADEVVSVRLDDPWEQAWALYYLRGQRLSVEHASFILTGQGSSTPASVYRHHPVDYTLAHDPRGVVLWRDGDIVLISERDRSPNRSRSALSLP